MAIFRNLYDIVDSLVEAASVSAHSIRVSAQIQEQLVTDQADEAAQQRLHKLNLNLADLEKRRLELEDKRQKTADRIKELLEEAGAASRTNPPTQPKEP